MEPPVENERPETRWQSWIDAREVKWYRRLWPLWVLIVFSIVSVILYQSGFDAPLYYDTASRLAENQNHFDNGFFDTVNIFRQRPVPMATFYANYMVSGMEPWSYRLVNALLLAATALIVIGLLATLMEISQPRIIQDRGLVRAVAVCLGLVFLVHPVQTYVVVYIWQRMALLAGLFSLASLLVYVAARSGRLRHAVLAYGGSALLFLLALASKENSVLLPAVFILAEIAFFRNTWRSLLARSAVCIGVTVLFVGGLSSLQSPHGLQESSGIVSTLGRYYRESGLTIFQVVLTESRVLFSYLEMILLPTRENVRLFSPQIVSTSALNPPATLAALAGVGALLLCGLYALRRRPLTGFGIMFFLINLLPESLLVPQYLFLGYRVIMPMVGILAVAADALGWLISRVKSESFKTPVIATVSVAYCVAVLLMGWVAHSKAALWRTPVVFWQDVVERLPQDTVHRERHGTRQAYTSLGMYLQQEGRLDEAIALYKRALASDASSFPMLVSLGNAYAAQGEIRRARSCFNRALKVDPKSSDAHLALGRLLVREGKPGEAFKEFEKAVSLNPDSALALYEIGRIYLCRGDARRASEHLAAAVASSPRLFQAHYSLGKTFMKLGDYRSALRSLQRTLELRPDHWQSHNDMGVVFGTVGRPDKAAHHFREALRINPGHLPTKRNLDAAVEQMRPGGKSTP